MSKSRFKFIKKSGGRCAVLHKEPTLFGEAWVTLVSFQGCEVRMKKIVQLLKECETISEKYGK